MKPDDECRFTTCHEERITDTLWCRAHLNDWWAGRIRRLADGSFIGVAGPRERKPAWVERMAENAKILGPVA